MTIGVRTCVRCLEVDPFGPIIPTPQRHRLLVYLVSQNHWNDVVCLHYSLSFCQQSIPINCEQYFFLVSRHYPSIQWMRDTSLTHSNPLSHIVWPNGLRLTIHPSTGVGWLWPQLHSMSWSPMPCSVYCGSCDDGSEYQGLGGLNETANPIDWQFKIEDARNKMISLYPPIQ